MRPRYHYAPAANWLSDPNGLVHHGGLWHLFYQYNPHGEDWGHMAWGHATSADLVDWQEHPPALVEADGVMIFSGSAVVDATDSAGFGKGALVAIYTGAQIAAEGRLPQQYQCLAFSIDGGGRQWTKFSGNPVLDEGLADFRDPNVIRHEASGLWVMTLVRSAENCAAIYTSHDLQHWTERSRIPTDGAPGHLWECPLLIELPVEGTQQSRWLFKVDVLSGAPGSGALYRTGHFDGTRFVAEGPWRVADHGGDFYAAIAWHAPRDAQGRPAWIGWMGNHAVQAQLPPQGWRGAMSLPRRLSLVPAPDGQGHVLRQMVEPALAARLGTPQALPLDLQRQTLPMAVRVAVPAQDVPDAEGWEIEIADAAGSAILLEREGGHLRVTRHDMATPALHLVRELALPASVGLTLWLDHGSLELLDDSGTVALTLQHRLTGEVAAWRADGAVRARMQTFQSA